jgi:hypothetical protein
MRFLEYTQAERFDVDAWSRLQARAKAEGAELVPAVKPSHAAQKVAEFNARAAGVAAGDNRAFLDNLTDIAAGRATVK